MMRKTWIIGIVVVVSLLMVYLCDSNGDVYDAIDKRIQNMANRDGVDLSDFSKKEKTHNNKYAPFSKILPARDYAIIYSKILPTKDTAFIIGEQDYDGYSITSVNGAYFYLVKRKYEVNKDGKLVKRLSDNMTALFGKDSMKIKLSPLQKQIEKEFNFTKSSEYLLNDLRKGYFFYKGKRNDTLFVEFYSPYAQDNYKYDGKIFNTYDKAMSIIIREKTNPYEITICPLTETIDYDTSY